MLGRHRWRMGSSAAGLQSIRCRYARAQRSMNSDGRGSTRGKRLVLRFWRRYAPCCYDDAGGSRRLQGAHSNSCSSWSNSSTRLLASPLPFDPSCSDTEARTDWPTERL